MQQELWPQRALGPESSGADSEDGLAMAFLLTEISKSTATTTEHCVSSMVLFTQLFVQPTNI